MAKEWFVRKYTSEDENRLRSFFVNLWGNRLDGRVGAEGLMTSATANNSTVLLVEEDEQIVGYGEFKNAGFGRMHFNRSAVLPNYRQGGIFASILQAVVTEAGRKEITAEVSFDAPHLSTMCRSGFEEVNREGTRVYIKRPRRKLFGFI